MDRGDKHETSIKRKKSENRKRFSDEQIKLLEAIFESETRIEPRKKMQLAVELGLQPRQVSIWFQNKRARWKTKQIEHEYRTLTAEYEDLMSRFECIKEEKQSLLLQLQKLKGLVEKPRDINLDAKVSERVLFSSQQCIDRNRCWCANLSEDRTYSGLNERSIEPGVEQIKDASSSASTENWDCFEMESCNISQWLDFWS